LTTEAAAGRIFFRFSRVRSESRDVDPQVGEQVGGDGGVPAAVGQDGHPVVADGGQAGKGLGGREQLVGIFDHDDAGPFEGAALATSDIPARAPVWDPAERLPVAERPLLSSTMGFFRVVL
jgi:hypothetical protein